MRSGLSGQMVIPNVVGGTLLPVLCEHWRGYDLLVAPSQYPCMQCVFSR